MSEEEQKKIFAKNLNKYISESGKTQKEIADSINVSPQTFNTWVQGIALPRMGKVQLLSDYFHINKSSLIEEHTDKPITAAAHRIDMDDLNESEVDEVARYIEFIRSKRGK